MSWFDARFATLAKTAITTAQKNIDKALDFQNLQSGTKIPKNETEQLFEEYGLSSNSSNSEKEPKTNPSSSKPKEGGFWTEWGTYLIDQGEQIRSTISMVDKTLKQDPLADESSGITVRSQPQRSKLFPSSSKEGETSNITSETLEMPIQQQPSKSLQLRAASLSEESCSNLNPILDSEISTEVASIDVEAMELPNKEINECESSLETLKDNDSTMELSKEVQDEDTIVIEPPPSIKVEQLSESDDEHVELDSNETPTINEEDEPKNFETKSFSSAASLCTSSSSSFIKVEEFDSSRGAITPVSATASDRSDIMKPEHYTSSEETSSDIEIISLLSLDNQHIPPNKQVWVSKGSKCKRSDSPNSDNNMPVVPEEKMHKKLNNDQDSDVQEYQESFDSHEHLLTKINEYQEIVDMREKKVFDLSKENTTLIESKAVLENQLKHLQEVYSKETKDFTKRLAQMEQAFQIVTQDRNEIQKKLDNVQKESSLKPNIKELQDLLKEKGTQIAELLKEGEILSKQQLQYSNTIKKLRNKEKDTESHLKTLKEKMEEDNLDLDRLRKSMEAKDEQEEKHIEIINQLNQALTKMEKDLSWQQSESEDLKEKNLSLKSSLDSTYKQLANVHKELAEAEGKSQELALSSELAAQAKLKEALVISCKEKQALIAQLSESQQEMKQTEKEVFNRTQLLESEITKLQHMLREMESQSQEVTTQISAATLPLLQQIEHLQKNLKNGILEWETNETKLNDSLTTLKDQLSRFQIKEQTLIIQKMDQEKKLKEIQNQYESFRIQNLQLLSEVEILKPKLVELEESNQKGSKTLDELKNNFADEITTLKNEKEDLRKKLETLSQSQTDQVSEPIARSASLSRLSSVSDSPWQDDSLSNISKMPLYDNVKNTCVFEGLQTRLKLKEGEVYSLQAELRQKDKLKESFGNEITSLSRENEHLKIEVASLGELRTLHQDLTQKYNTLLQMFGEKAEEVEELKLDLQDVKSMYRNQLDELLGKKQ